MTKSNCEVIADRPYQSNFGILVQYLIALGAQEKLPICAAMEFRCERSALNRKSEIRMVILSPPKADGVAICREQTMVNSRECRSSLRNQGMVGQVLLQSGPLAGHFQTSRNLSSES